MKKEIWWIIGGTSLVLGLILIAFASFGGAGGIYITDNGLEIVGETIVKEETIRAGFTAVNVYCDLSEVEMRPSADGSYGYKITYTDSHFADVSAEVAGGTLTISNKNIKPWTVNLSLPWVIGAEFKLVITYPANSTFERVDIESALGTVRLNDFETETLNVTADCGDVSADGVVSRNTEMNLEMGKLKFAGTLYDHTELSLACGDLSFDGELYGYTDVVAHLGNVSINTAVPEEDYAFDLEVSLGNITVGGRSASGSTSVIGGTGDNSLRVKCDLGNIDVTFARDGAAAVGRK
ncbi:MAG: DUF4097 domain-containing protein [Oscillospiraceae bacterium]|nr:DUF4097 domain-containing protein [Oscillospiraceae bacterium]